MEYILLSRIIYIFCICLLAICLLGLFFQRNEKSVSSKRFSLIIYSAILFLVLNIITDALDKKTDATVAAFVFNVLVFIAVDIVVLSFNFYLQALTKNTKNKKLTYALGYTILFTTIARVIVIIVLAATNNLFIINSKGEYTPQAYEFVPYVITAIIMVEFIIMIIMNRKCFTKRQFVVVLLYEVLPLIPIIVEMFYPIYVLTPVAITLSIVMIYVLIQDTTITMSKMREQFLEDISNTDLLTETNNRRAFYTCLKDIEKETSLSTGAIFCDINGLKTINDKYGHAAGDELIKKFAHLLMSSLGKDNVFRISGDEFVAIIKTNSEKEFLNIAKSFNSLLKKNDNIAAIGYAYGKSADINNLIRDAEKLMYKDKAQFGVSR